MKFKRVKSIWCHYYKIFFTQINYIAHLYLISNSYMLNVALEITKSDLKSSISLLFKSSAIDFFKVFEKNLDFIV